MELFLNRVWATLAAGMDEVQTSLYLSTGHGARFGTIGAGDKVRIVLLDATANVSEVMYATARTGDTLTVSRGQDGTIAVTHLAGDRLEHRIGKSTMDIITQKVKAGTDAVAEMHAAASKATPVDADELFIGDSEATFGLKKLTWANLKATLISTWKDVTGGLVGLTLFKINFKNAANTFTSFLQNVNTAVRTYTFQDRDGTILDNTDYNNLTNAINGKAATNQTMYIGTTAVAINRGSAGLSLTGVSIDGNAATSGSAGVANSVSNGCISGVSLTSDSAGEYAVSWPTGYKSNSSVSPTKMHEWNIGRPGTYRFRVALNVTGVTGGSSIAYLYNNGSLVGTIVSTTLTSGIVYGYLDATVGQNNKMQVYTAQTNGEAITVSAKVLSAAPFDPSLLHTDSYGPW